MLVALIHAPSPRMAECELTYLDRQSIDYERAREQHRAYGRALAAAGTQVHELAVNIGYPDGAFIEDVAVLLDEVAVICSMGAPSRSIEAERLAPVLARYREIERIEPPGTLEGGDVLRVDRTLYVGLSRRTNKAGIAGLRRIVDPLGYRVVALEVRGCLHLKTCCTAIDETAALVNPSWLAPDALGHLRADGLEIVPVPPEEPWAANVVVLPTRVILSAAHPRTAELLLRRGCEVESVDLSEFAKAEAGATCLSILFEDYGVR